MVELRILRNVLLAEPLPSSPQRLQMYRCGCGLAEFADIGLVGTLRFLSADQSLNEWLPRWKLYDQIPESQQISGTGKSDQTRNRLIANNR